MDLRFLCLDLTLSYVFIDIVCFHFYEDNYSLFLFDFSFSPFSLYIEVFGVGFGVGYFPELEEEKKEDE